MEKNLTYYYRVHEGWAICPSLIFSFISGYQYENVGKKDIIEIL